jgi:hypothetical protein
VTVDYGIPDEELYPEPSAAMSYSEYINVDLIPVTVRTDAKKHKSKSYWTVTRDFNAYMQAIYQMETPVMTGSVWYTSDNTTKGIWRKPFGNNVGGHAYRVIGWIRWEGQQVLVVANSWGPWWGINGLFFIPSSLMTRLFEGWMTVDIPYDKAKVIAKYNGKNIKADGKPDIYFISEGQKHSYPDELVWWSKGNMFAGGFVVAEQNEIDLIPKGKEMTFDYGHKWSADQIKEMLNLIGTDSKRAEELNRRYF